MKQTSRFSLTDGGVRIADFDQAPPFTSFLPGLSGVQGIPVWAYYCNRGQALESLGVHQKGDAMMEFHPANVAYEKVAQEGFRTFIRVSGAVREPFSPLTRQQRVMTVSQNALVIEEENAALGLRVRVEYATLPDAPIGALMRGVTVTNASNANIALEMLDGLPRIIPYGLSLGAFQSTGNLFKSWADVTNLERRAPMYILRSSTNDSAEVSEVSGAFFACCASGGALLPMVYDPQAVFGEDTSLALPRVFAEGGLSGVLSQAQCAVNRIACGFAAVSATLAPGESLRLDGYFGYTPSAALLCEQLADFASAEYADEKRSRARTIARDMTRDVRAKTGMPLLDGYIEQSYLDNFLRGGYAVSLGGQVLHLYSRKHGDPERDYNWFTLAGEPYSQGNGNFRDVCQNRRADVSLHPFVGDWNVYAFFSLVQADGANPLEIRPTTFTPRDASAVDALLTNAAGEKRAALKPVLAAPFTPGMVAAAVAKAGLALAMPEDAFMARLLSLCEPRIEATFGEGYWSDHFDYLLDLIEDYLRVYPDNKRALLYDRRDYAFFDSGAHVRRLSESAQMTGKGVRLYDALDTSRAKQGAHWLKGADGETVRVNLAGKLLTLVVTKAAQLDPDGLGVSMTGGKPGWNDAMNGLPGLFGSGMPETLELDRLLAFLLNAEDGEALVPAELASLLRALETAYAPDTPLARWRAATEAMEDYREAVRGGVSGEVLALHLSDVTPCLRLLKSRVEEGISRALGIGQGVMPTYFAYDVTAYTPVLDDSGAPRLSAQGNPLVTPTAFRRVAAPLFLEGPARFLASPAADAETAGAMAALVRQSGLYDEKLRMYLTSEPLDAMSMEFGRVRAFTPGWLERESVFVHMEYKYLLGLLKAGLHAEFYEAAFAALIPFLDPDVYGRSTLENCSFIASSRNPDPRVHGRGFVSRLSGSTAETLSIWQHMTLGDGGYETRDGSLRFRFAPVLAGRLFDENGELSFTLHSRCQVVYHNPSRRDTFGAGGVSPVLTSYDMIEGRIEVAGDALPDGEALRNGLISRVDVTLA